MSPTVLDTTPLATQARILRQVAGSAHPRLEIPTIAANHQLTLQQVQTILQHHGYPDGRRMVGWAAELEERAANERLAAVDDEEQGDADEEPTPAPRPQVTPAPAVGEKRLLKVPLTQLYADPDNIRADVGDITELADSMVEVGLLQPIVARRTTSGRLYVVAGHRRLAAARHLKWTDVDVVVRADMRPDEVLAAMLIENGQRTDLDPIEEARGLGRLKQQLGCSDGKLAGKVGRSQAYVSGRLQLLALSAEDQEAVRRGEMKLVEATHRGRLNSGRVGKTGVDRNWHLGPQHGLSTRVKARCQRMQHPRGRTVGGMGCGECWESVIRADERERIQALSSELGKCVSCDAPIAKAAG